MVTLISTILVIIGAINWLAIGIFSFNIVTWICGAGVIARIIYSIVGVAGIWLLGVLIYKKGKLSKI